MTRSQQHVAAGEIHRLAKVHSDPTCKQLGGPQKAGSMPQKSESCRLAQDVPATTNNHAMVAVDAAGAGAGGKPFSLRFIAIL